MTRQEHLLSCLAEECTEVGKEVSKIHRFGLNNSPIQSLGGKVLEPNSERLQQEVIDVIAVVDMLHESEGLFPVFDDEEEFEERIAAKQAKVEKYMKYAHSKGMIEIK